MILVLNKARVMVIAFFCFLVLVLSSSKFKIRKFDCRNAVKWLGPGLEIESVGLLETNYQVLRPKQTK